MLLTEDQKTFYHENGYLSPIRICDLDTAAYHQEEFNKIETELGKEKCAEAHRMTGRFIFDDAFGKKFVWDIVSNTALLDTIEGLLGDFHLLNNTRFFCRYGQDPDKYVAWHQDLTYMQMDPPELITAWYAIDDTDDDNGCLRVIPGTHRTKKFYEHGESSDKGNILNRNQEVFLDDDLKEKAISLPLKKGEVSIFSGFLLHGSPPNQSQRRRCGLSIRYVPVYSKPGHDKISIGIHMRGTDRYNYYEQREVPF